MNLHHTHKKWVNTSLAVSLSAGLLAACGSGEEAKPASSPAAGSPAAGSAAPGASGAAATAWTPITISYWVPMDPNTARSLKTYNDSLFFQELEKRTQVKVNFQHTSTTTEKEQFNLLMASGNLPDVVEYNWTLYSGGPEKAITDKKIIPLNDLIDKNGPNLKKYLAEHPDIKKEITTDEGIIYSFPSIGTGNVNVSNGLVLRKDWLDELGLKAPETIDEWTNVLRQFKEKKGAKTPLTMVKGDFLDNERFNGAFNVGRSFYVDNGKVKYGPQEAGYKDYLKVLNAWYKEGLLDPDFATQDAKSRDAKVANGSAGAFVSGIGAISTYIKSGQTSNPKYDLTPAQHPVLKAGNQPTIFNASYDYRGIGSAAITPANKNPAETVRWLDYLYSKEGHILKSYGVEGVTFKWEGDYPRYTDLILKNPDKLTIAEAMSKYLRVAYPSPGFVGDKYYTDQYYEYPQQKQAVEVFNKYYTNVDKNRYPRASNTPEESREISPINSEIETYRQEMFLKFVLGGESLDNFDKYVKQLKTMKIDRAVELKQAALDRYNKR